MASSLDSLTRNLVGACTPPGGGGKGEKLFGFENYSELQYDLLTRKGVYPYEYMSSWDKFKESLPPIEAFYSKLNMSKIDEDDHQHAQRVWKEFGIRNLGDYHDLYLRTDVVLLANVFEAFRDTCLKHCRLDPAHFYAAPGLAWKACLRLTSIKLELPFDPDMLIMFERGIRGGITQAVHRYASANNKYMGNLYDPNKESSYPQYLDASNHVVLLANVYKAFRDTCLRHYSLDPAHFYTSPGLAWKACLKCTGIRLKLLTDPDMLLMFERGIRGGITLQFINTL